MFSLEKIREYLSTLKDTSCGETCRMIRKMVIGESKVIQVRNDIYRSDEPNFLEVNERIRKIIEEYGYCEVWLSTENKDGMAHYAVNHAFVLMKIEGKIYRIESYYNCYLPRMVEFDDFKERFLELKRSLGDGKFIEEYNKLFGCDEERIDEYNILATEIFYLKK